MTVASYEQDILDHISYDPETGNVWRIKSTHGNSVAGHKFSSRNGRGYCIFEYRGKVWLVHRFAFLFMTGKIPETVDHINGRFDDNRWDNLRPANRMEQAQNRRTRKDNKLGVKGVYARRGKFHASIRANGRAIHLGDFDTVEQAATAYAHAAENLFGEFACVGTR